MFIWTWNIYLKRARDSSSPFWIVWPCLLLDALKLSDEICLIQVMK